MQASASNVQVRGIIFSLPVQPVQQVLPFFPAPCSLLCPFFLTAVLTPGPLLQARLETYKAAKEAQSAEALKAELDAKMAKAAAKHEDILKMKVEVCVRPPSARALALAARCGPSSPPPHTSFPCSAQSEIAKATASGAAAIAAGTSGATAGPEAAAKENGSQ